MSPTYAVTAKQNRKWWTFEIPELTTPAPGTGAHRTPATGQARTAREITTEARELIAEVAEISPDTIEVSVSYDLPETITSALARARQRDADGRAALDEAAALRRAAVHNLIDAGLSQADIAVILGVSRQRVQQLINS